MKFHSKNNYNQLSKKGRLFFLGKKSIVTSAMNEQGYPLLFVILASIFFVKDTSSYAIVVLPLVPTFFFVSLMLIVSNRKKKEFENTILSIKVYENKINVLCFRVSQYWWKFTVEEREVCFEGKFKVEQHLGLLDDFKYIISDSKHKLVLVPAFFQYDYLVKNVNALKEKGYDLNIPMVTN